MTAPVIERALANFGVPHAEPTSLPSSPLRFADGGQYRIEIPSTEDAAAVRVIAEEAARLDVPIHRISQGSGVMMLTDRELDDLVAASAEARYELSLFARPLAGWSPAAMTASPAGGALTPAARGANQLVHCLEDILRAAEHGVRNVLIGDLGVLAVFNQMRDDGDLPGDMQAKVSVMMPAANPASAKVMVALGANSLNLPTDLQLDQIAAIRAAIDVPIDFYVEAPSNLGGFVQLNLIPEIIRIAAPVYIKFGLRNGPDIYPIGEHLRQSAIAMSRERVRRARLGLELLARSGADTVMSPIGGDDLRIPRADENAVHLARLVSTHTDPRAIGL